MCLLLVSCTGKEQQQEEISSVDEYFPVRELLAQTREQMLEMDVRLEKEATFSGETEKSVVVPDSLALAGELEVFRGTDINKPVFSGRYKESREEVNGQEVITYQADDPETLNVHYLKIHKNLTSGKVEQLEAFFSSKNILYSSTRLVNLHFASVNGFNLPQSYRVNGSQKMIFSGEEDYLVEGKFLYPE